MPNLNYTLKQHNVTLLDEKNLSLQCDKCKQTWNPKMLEGRLLKGYWQCPNGCNFEPKTYKHSPEIRAYFANRNRVQRAKKVLEIGKKTAVVGANIAVDMANEGISNYAKSRIKSAANDYRVQRLIEQALSSNRGVSILARTKLQKEYPENFKELEAGKP